LNMQPGVFAAEFEAREVPKADTSPSSANDDHDGDDHDGDDKADFADFAQKAKDKVLSEMEAEGKKKMEMAGKLPAVDAVDAAEHAADAAAADAADAAADGPSDASDSGKNSGVGESLVDPMDSSDTSKRNEAAKKKVTELVELGNEISKGKHEVARLKKTDKRAAAAEEKMLEGQVRTAQQLQISAAADCQKDTSCKTGMHLIENSLKEKRKAEDSLSTLLELTSEYTNDQQGGKADEQMQKSLGMLRNCFGGR